MDTVQERYFDSTDTGNLGKSEQGIEHAIFWLEHLAELHGALPESLTTTPTQRAVFQDQAPGWIQEAASLPKTKTKIIIPSQQESL